MAHEKNNLTPTLTPPLTSAIPDHELPIRPPNNEDLPIAPPTDNETGKSAHRNIQEFANLLLEFLSSASNESLAACAVGLGISTYLLLGRFGLVLIGVLGGIVLHATWEFNGQDHGDNHAKAFELKRRREVGLDVVSRILDWRETKTSDQSFNGVATSFLGATSLEHTLLDYSSFRPATGAALDALTNAIIRDYVKWWYGPLLPLDESFPSSCRQILVQFVSTASSHLIRKRPADTFIDFLTNSSSIAIVFMNELSSALMDPGAYNANCSDVLYRYLEQNPSSHLSNVVDMEQQQRKLKAVADDILHSFLDPAAYKCGPVRAFLREILAGLVLEMTVQTCSKPEFINTWIIYLLEEADSEIIDIIDAGVGGATANGAPNASPQSPPNVVIAGREHGMEAAQGQSEAAIKHKRTVSRAEDAMEEAMQEAKRLTELIAAEEAKRIREPETEKAHQGRAMTEISSSATTPNGPTPNSSASDLAASAQSLEDYRTIDTIPAVGSSTVPSFTSFDQILPPKQTTALQNGVPTSAPAIPPLTLHNATVSIFDDAQPGEKGTMRSKPQAEYLIQIEPATPQHPGWMIARKYPDFETLHEVLRRISVVSGVPAFAQKHSSLPAWKNRTKALLRRDLEHYLHDALSFNRLAESEGMKRFLEKDQGPDGSSSGATKASFGFPSPAAFETMGKGMLDVLASAPKGAAGGGKAILGGFTGVVGGLGSIGQKKQVSDSSNRASSRSVSRPSSSLTRMESFDPSRTDPIGAIEAHDDAHDASNASGSVIRSLSNEPGETSPEQTDRAVTHIAHEESLQYPDTSPRNSRGDLNGIDEVKLHLPPPPSEISDEYNAFGDPPRLANSTDNRSPPSSPLPAPKSTETTSPRVAISVPSQTQTRGPIAAPLSEMESRVAVELFFALIQELYTLSSAWNIRRTLLNAAKSYLLRPGNPSLISIQQLLQSSLDTMTSDEGIAAYVAKLRENSLPTEEEREKWPEPPNDEEKERLRIKARKLLVQKGMPVALTSVMGAAASGEALGRVFDSLQVESVARGFMFAIILQGIRALTQ